jgi:hypothetical protein
MKTFHRILPLLALVFLGTSCMQVGNLEITKRHYRKGLYIDLHTSHKTTPVTSALTPRAKEEGTVPGNRTVSAPETGVINEVEPNIPPSSTLKTVSHELKPPVTDGSIPLSKLLFKRKSFPSFYTGKFSDHEGGGYWLWTLIAILIVIWLISLLTGGWGLGGLIYIFLVVALVLLLLRLLSIL